MTHQNINTASTSPHEITDILNMPRGARIVYHVGFLAVDRGGDAKRTAKQDSIRETGNIAWKLKEQGKVTLCQRRLGHELYEYIAERV